MGAHTGRQELGLWPLSPAFSRAHQERLPRHGCGGQAPEGGLSWARPPLPKNPRPPPPRTRTRDQAQRSWQAGPRPGEQAEAAVTPSARAAPAAATGSPSADLAAASALGPTCVTWLPAHDSPQSRYGGLTPGPLGGSSSDEDGKQHPMFPSTCQATSTVPRAPLDPG